MADNREKYESLTAGALKDLLKARGAKGFTALKKAELVETMLKMDADEAKSAPKKKASAKKTTAKKPVEESDKKQITEKKEAGKSVGKKSSGRKPASKKVTEPEIASEEKADVTEAQTDVKSEKKTVAAVEQKEERKPRRRMVHNTDAGERQERGDRRNGGQVRHRKAVRTHTVSGEETASKPEHIHTIAAEPSVQEVKPAEHEEHVSDIPVVEEVTKEQTVKSETEKVDNTPDVTGILEVLTEGYGFLRSDNYMPGEDDVYVSPSQIRRFHLRTGDIITGKTRKNNPNDKFAALMFILAVNGMQPERAALRKNFEDLTPIFPDERVKLERPGCSVAMRVVDLVSPIGKGQRGMIVAQPKAGKTTLLKEIAKSITKNNPEMHLIILLIDERPEEVTDMKESIEADNVEVIYSTFDETPEHHKRVSEMVIERARRLVEQHQDVIILLDSITRLARAYNLTVAPSGRTLSGGLDPAALHMPKRFFGAARNMREGGSLTILATALVETGSKMDDVVFEEFKGTGNMELVLDRKLSERRIFPAIDINRSGTRRDDLLLDTKEQQAMEIIHRGINGRNKDDAIETILNMFAHTKNNDDFIAQILRRRVL